jgi:RNA recognition motif-containing protein
MINLQTGQSKCFGFVRFTKLAEAQAAIAGLNGLAIGSKRLLVKYAESKEKEELPSKMVYIKRLPITVHPNDVVQMFSRFGEVLDITPHTFDSADPQFWRCIVRYSTF